MRNALINVIWTIIGFFPICLFWYYEEINFLFYILLLTAFLAGCLSERVYISLHISKDIKVYEKLGVRFVRRFMQTGNFSKNRGSGIKGYLKELSMFERYHYICLVFFQATAFYACFNHKLILALLVACSNLIYNVYPILLQQYNKIRMLKIYRTVLN
jgi:hypothetical protein